MQAILELFGWESYQATCLTPVLWVIVFSAALSMAVGLAYDATQRKAQRNRKRYHINRK